MGRERASGSGLVEGNPNVPIYEYMVPSGRSQVSCDTIILIYYNLRQQQPKRLWFENIPEKRKVLDIVLVNIQINRAENIKAETITMEGFQFVSRTRQKLKLQTHIVRAKKVKDY